jgi:hypothetical protein
MNDGHHRDTHRYSEHTARDLPFAVLTVKVLTSDLFMKNTDMCLQQRGNICYLLKCLTGKHMFHNLAG